MGFGGAGGGEDSLTLLGSCPPQHRAEECTHAHVHKYVTTCTP